MCAYSKVNLDARVIFLLTCYIIFIIFLGYKLFPPGFDFWVCSLTLGAIFCHSLAGIRGALEQRTSRKYSVTLSNTKSASNSSVKMHSPLRAGELSFGAGFFHFATLK